MDNQLPVSQPTISSPAPVISSTTPKKAGKKRLAAIFLLVILLASTGVVAYLWRKSEQKANDVSKIVPTLEQENASLADRVRSLEGELEKRKETTGEENINKELYQAVFLKSEQVYFGKITKLTETQIVLTDIYYLRAEGTPDVSLAKLGNELHGPEDTMYIERKEVTFWENLKAEGEVSKAIADYLASQD